MNNVNYVKSVPVAYKTDVCIVGGGIAGIAAAMAAAASGTNVLLIERFGVLGGNATTGGVANFCGNCAGQGEAFDTIIRTLELFNAISGKNKGKRGLGGRVFNHEILAVILPELMEKRGIRYLLHTQMVDVKVSSGHVEHVLVCGPSGLQAVEAKVFIDCSGDGLLAHRAGFATMKGNAEGYQLPMSLMYFVRRVTPEQYTCEVPEGWFRSIETKDDLPMNTFWPNGSGSSALKIKVPMFDSTDTESLTCAEVSGRREMMAVLDYYQRVEKRPIILDHCSPLIGIREGYRIWGDYVLTVDDLRVGRGFDDVIAVGTFYLDGHKPDDNKRTYILDPSTLDVPPYDIPLRSIIAKDGDNLLMAGRCFSADQLALSSARVMTTCAMLGQAAGVLAALSSEKNVAVRDVHYSLVQDVLVKRGAVLDKGKVSEMLGMK